MEKTAVTCVSWFPRGSCSGRLVGAQQEEALDLWNSCGNTHSNHTPRIDGVDAASQRVICALSSERARRMMMR